jgi:hypothetical protein
MAELKYICDECGWTGTDKQVLEAINPFDDDNAIMLGCPDCRAADHMTKACEHAGCWQRATVGGKHKDGIYKWTCYRHSAFALQEREGA